MAQRRLLILMTDLLIGGVPMVVRSLALEMRRQGVDVQVAGLGRWGPIADQIQAGGVKVTGLGAASVKDVGVLERLVKLIRQERVDTVLSCLAHANLAAAYSKLRCRGLCVFASIHTTQSYPRWHWKAQRLVKGLVDGFIVPSQAVLEVAQRWSGINPERITVIPNPVDIDALREIVPQGFDRRPLPVGFVGRLDPIKRIPDLLEAARLLQGQVHLHIFGTGEQEALIRQRIADLGIGSGVTLHGAVASIREALPQVSLLVLPSEAEGFGMVLVEAMAAGLPVVATDIPGVRNVVTDGQSGLLVPVGSPQAIAGAIERLMADSALRHSLVVHARGGGIERYRTAEVVKAYRQILGV